MKPAGSRLDGRVVATMAGALRKWGRRVRNPELPASVCQSAADGGGTGCRAWRGFARRAALQRIRGSNGLGIVVGGRSWQWAGLAELGLGDPAGALARVAEPRTAGWKPAPDMGNRLEAGWRGAQRPGWAQYVPGTHRAHLVCLTRDRQFQRLGDAR